MRSISCLVIFAFVLSLVGAAPLPGGGSGTRSAGKGSAFAAKKEHEFLAQEHSEASQVRERKKQERMQEAVRKSLLRD